MRVKEFVSTRCYQKYSKFIYTSNRETFLHPLRVSILLGILLLLIYILIGVKIMWVFFGMEVFFLNSSLYLHLVYLLWVAGKIEFFCLDISGWTQFWNSEEAFEVLCIAPLTLLICVNGNDGIHPPVAKKVILRTLDWNILSYIGSWTRPCRIESKDR